MSYSSQRVVAVATGSVFFILASFLLSPALSPAEPGLKAGLDGHGRIGCPDCQNDGSEISHLLRRADTLYSRFKSKETEKVLLKILKLDPRNHEALSKLARVYIDLGDLVPESSPDWERKRVEKYRIAEQYAREAVKTKPDGTWGHFYVAASLGKIAMHSSIARQLDLANEIQAEASRAIDLDPQNGYAHHILGVWHRRVAEIGHMSRFLAYTVLWRSVPQGSLEESLKYLKKATALNPDVITHHLELAKTYAAMGKWELARIQLKAVEALPIQFSNDHILKRDARILLQKIKDY